MKTIFKIIIFIFAIMILFSFASCVTMNKFIYEKQHEKKLDCELMSPDVVYCKNYGKFTR